MSHLAQIWQLLENYASALWLQEISELKSLKTKTFFYIGKKGKSVKFFKITYRKFCHHNDCKKV